MSYNRITLFGGIVCDFLQIVDGTATQIEIDTIANVYNHKPEWTSDTLFLTQFNENKIDAGNVMNLSGELTGWQVYREEVGKSNLEFVKTVGVDTNSCLDFNVGANRSYKYHVFPSTDNEIGARLQSDIITTDFYNWSLTSLTPTNVEGHYTAGDIFLFDLNLSSGEVQTNYDVAQYPGFTKYNKTSRSPRQFRTGSLNALIGNMDNNGDYIDTITLRQQLEDFVNDGKYKLLKNRKGDVLLVNILGLSFKFEDITSEQITYVTINYQEIGTVDGIVVTD